MSGDNKYSSDIWWCARKEEWHWCLVWEDDKSHGTQMQSGLAPTERQAQEDIVRTMNWVESNT